LAQVGTVGEIYLAGGAVMCLVHRAREATKDVDAMLVPAQALRDAARTVARREGISEDWVNDAVKAFFSNAGRFNVFGSLSHLKIYVPETEYLLAMKCLAVRMGEEFHDIDDVRTLLAALNVTEMSGVDAILAKYYPLDRYPARARYILEELLPD
jgi:hypothetical protein